MNLYGKNNHISSLRGARDSLVVIDITTIREATIKLLEREYLLETVAQQDTIIINQNQIIDNYKSYNLYLANENLKLQESYNDIEKLNENLEKSIKCKNTGLWVFGSIAFTSMIITILKCTIDGK